MNAHPSYRFDAQRVEQVLKSRLPGIGVLWVEDSESTNRDLMRMAETGAPEWTVLVADRQTAGRGRHQRPWVSPAGGLYVSLLLRLRNPSSPITLIPLLIGLSLVEGLRDEAKELGGTLDTLWLKWPNDILTDRGKLAGILCETAETGGEWMVVAGIGMNMAPLSKDVKQSNAVLSTSLKEEADLGWGREGVLVSFLLRLADRLDDWKRDPGIIRRDYVNTSGLFGRSILVKSGKGPVAGIAEGISDIGALRVRTDQGTVEINAAEGIEVNNGG